MKIFFLQLVHNAYIGVIRCTYYRVAHRRRNYFDWAISSNVALKMASTRTSFSSGSEKCEPIWSVCSAILVGCSSPVWLASWQILLTGYYWGWIALYSCVFSPGKAPKYLLIMMGFCRLIGVKACFDIPGCSFCWAYPWDALGLPSLCMLRFLKPCLASPSSFLQ